MPMHDTLDTILKKEMSRKEFLGMVGLGIISLMGVSSLLKNLGNTFSKPQSSQSSLGYGDSSYGGASPKTPSLHL